MRRPFREAESRIQEDRLASNPPLRGARYRLLELADDVDDDIAVNGALVHLAGASACVHEHHRRAGLRRGGRQFRIVLESADVVDDRGARRKRQTGGARPVGVDREEGAGACRESLYDRHHPPQFFFLANRVRARPRRFSTDVEDVRAVFHHAQPCVDCVLDMKMHPPVGERVGRDVEDAHDERPLAQDEFASAG
jgi:hypothetical protein